MYECLVLALLGDGVRIEPFTLVSDPKLSNGRERSFHHRHESKGAILESAAENAHFQRNMRSKHTEHVCLGCLWKSPKAQKSTPEKSFSNKVTWLC